MPLKIFDIKSDNLPEGVFFCRHARVTRRKHKDTDLRLICLI